MSFTRRAFLQGTGLGWIALNSPLPVLAASEPSGNNHALVLIQLAGGNDGLGTIAPLSDPLYKKLRPTVGLNPNEVAALDQGLSIHGAMTKLLERYGNKEVAVVQGVGYADSSRSHFEAMAVWQTAKLNPHLDPDGWLGRARMGQSKQFEGPFAMVGVGGGALSPSLFASQSPATALSSLDAFAAQPDKRFPGDAPALFAALKAIYEEKPNPTYPGAIRAVGRSALQSSDALKAAVTSYQSMVAYPKGGFGDQLKLAAQLLAVDLKVRVVHVTLGGFDTHANQKQQQRALLQQLSEGISALLDDAKMHGFADRVAVMTYSEFGRRASENGSGGTDHGAGSVLFLAGQSVAGGLHGPMLDLSKLDKQGDVPVGVDFRQVYASVLKDWLGMPYEPFLGKVATPLPLFRPGST